MKYYLIPRGYDYILVSDEEIKIGDYRLDFYATGGAGDIREVTNIEGDKIFDSPLIYNTRSSVMKVIASSILIDGIPLLDISKYSAIN